MLLVMIEYFDIANHCLIYFFLLPNQQI